MSNFFRKIGKVFKSIGKFLHKLWLKKKPVILSMIKGALYAFKPVLAKKIEEKKDDFKPDEIADFIIGYAITKMNVLLKHVSVIKKLAIGLLEGFKPKVVMMLQAKEDEIDPEELASDIMDRIYLDIKKRL